jgi:hypothetical protein
MTAIVALKLSAPASVTAAPFSFAQGFRKGDVPAGRYLVSDVPNSVVAPLCYWNDGSVKHAQVMGRANVSATPLLVSISSTSVQPAAGTVLTASSLASSGASVSVAVTGVGTVNLSDLLASPLRTHISTKEMVECHYAAPVGTDPHLYVLIYSRLYANGQREHDVVLGNGHLGGSPTQRDIAVTVTIEGAAAFTSSLYHLSAWAQFDAHGWSGTDPQITPQHDTGYLVRTKLVPNYWKFAAPTTAQLSYLNSINVYVPGSNLGHSDIMGGTGYQDGIGLLPRWDGMYVETLGCKPAFDAVIANARAINSYAVSLPEAANHGPIKITDYPTWSVYGAAQGGSYGLGAIKQDNVGVLSWEKAHHSQGGYLAYLLTGRMRFFDSLQHQARTVYLMEDINGGTGTDRIFRSQNRARGWGYRTMSMASALIPTDLAARYGDIKTWMAGMSAANNARYAGLTAFQKSLGFEDFYQNRGTPVYPGGPSVTTFGPFEFAFVAQAMGNALQLEPCDASGMTSVAAFADYVMGTAVWPLGVCQVGSTDFPFPYAYSYTLSVPSDGGSTAAGITATNYGQIYTASFSTDAATQVYNPGGNALLGSSGGDPTLSTGYWANLLPAISLAVEAGKNGAAAAFGRLTGASNWSLQVNAGYDDIPQFAIVPASYAQQPIQFTPVDSGVTQVTTPGPSIRVDTLPLHTAGFIVTKQPGIGTPGSQIAGTVTGADGTTPIRDAIVAAGGTFNPLSEYRAVPSPGAHGTLFIDDADLSQVYTGDGTYDTIAMAYYEDGAQFSTTPQYFGTAPVGSTVSGITVSPNTAVGSTTFSAVVNGTNSPSQAVTWSLNGSAGSINASTGVFIAPAATNAQQVITITATSVQDGTKSGTATVTIAALPVSAVTGVVVSPASGTLAGSGARTFTAVVNGNNSPSQAVTWATNLGTINPATGQLIAPAATNVAQTGTVTATSTQDNTKAGIATFTVAALTAPPNPSVSVTSVNVTPNGGTLVNGATRQYSAAVVGNNGPTQGVTWACDIGTIDAGGLYTPPVATYLTRLATITATSGFDPTKTGIATVTIAALTTPIVVADNNMLRLDADGYVANTGPNTFVERGRQFWIDKDPDAKLAYGIDLTDYLARAGEGLTLTAATARIAGVAAISDVRLQGNTIAVQLADGLSVLQDPSVVNQCTFHFTLSNGDEDERTINFSIVDN